MRLLPLLLIMSVTVSACGIIETKKIDYKSAGKLPTLEVPPDLTAPSGDNRYAIPDTQGSGSATISAYSQERKATPAGSTTLLPTQEKARIERAGTQRWLVVNATPEQVWPVIKDFWQETGFIVNLESPATGVIETDWAENRAKIPQDVIRRTIGKVIDGLYSTAERDKFRTRIEANKEGTEIYLSHRGMIEVYDSANKDRTVWQPRPADPELEAEMQYQVDTFACEWKATIDNHEKLKRFSHFVNNDVPDPSLMRIEERNQTRPPFEHERQLASIGAH